MGNDTLIHIDTYDFMKNDYRLEPSKLIESVISYDRLFLELGNPKITLSRMARLLSIDILEEYLRNKIITFCKTDIQYTISTGGMGNFIIPNPFTFKDEDSGETLSNREPEWDEYIWEAIEGINISQNRKKILNKVMLDNMLIIPSDRINQKLCLETVLDEINNVHLVNKIIENNNIKFNKRTLINELNYEVSLCDEGFRFTIKTVDFDKKNEFYTTLFIVLSILIYSNIFMNSSNIINSTGVWVDKSTSDVIENKYSRILSHHDKSNEVFKYLMKKERVPDIGELYDKGKISFKDIDRIRGKSEYLRKLIGRFNPSDEVEIYNTYLDFVQSNISHSDTIPMKILRFFAFSVVGGYIGGGFGSTIGSTVGNIIGSSLPSAFDTFLLPHLFKRPVQYIRFSDIKKDLQTGEIDSFKKYRVD